MFMSSRAIFYQPRRRGPYGPRYQRAYVDDSLRIPARLATRYGCQTVIMPMPRGRYRALVLCPECQTRRRELYTIWGRVACRGCLGLRYRSQYAGRRPEASQARIDALGEAVHTTRNPMRRGQRRERWERADAILEQRDDAYHRRIVIRHQLVMAWAACFDRYLDQVTRDAAISDRERHAAYMRAWRAKRRGRILAFPPARVRLGELLRRAA